MKCSFCQENCDGKMVLVDKQIAMKDGSNVVLCNTCINLYANHQYEELTKRLEQAQKTTTTS